MATKTISGQQKVLIIEYYLAYKTDGLNSISMDLDLTYNVLLKIVNQYETDKCVILPSKIN